MNKQDLTLQLHQLLQQDLDTTAAFLSVLNEEYEVLQANDPDRLDATIAAKQAMINEMNQNNDERNILFKQANIEFNNDGIRRMISLCSPDSRLELTHLWQQLEIELQACQEQNAINGAVIAAGHQYTQQLLAIITGQQHNGNEVYGKNGQVNRIQNGNSGHTQA